MIFFNSLIGNAMDPILLADPKWSLYRKDGSWFKVPKILNGPQKLVALEDFTSKHCETIKYKFFNKSY